MTLSDDLRAAKGLIDTPEKWLRGNLADKGNTCFCTFGGAQFGRLGLKEAEVVCVTGSNWL